MPSKRDFSSRHTSPSTDVDGLTGLFTNTLNISQSVVIQRNRRLALQYETRQGRTKSLLTAVQYYQQAVEAGCDKSAEDIKRIRRMRDIDAEDLNDIGVMYSNGEGVKEDFVQSQLWLQRAIAKGSASACRNLGFHYAEGLGVKKDLITAVEYYQRALDGGYSDAQEDIDAIYHSDDTTYKALNNIALLYYRGTEVNQDLQEAKRWFTKAANKDSAIACYNLGIMYENGYGVTPNYARAVSYYWRALQGGYSKAESSIANIFRDSETTVQDFRTVGIMYINKQDYCEAMKWLKRAKGDACAYRYMGFLYQKGFGVKADPIMAAKYYIQALANGYERVQKDIDSMDLTDEQWHELGQDYYHAWHGMAEDSVLARLCFQQVIHINSKYKDAHDYLGWIYEHGEEVKVNLIRARKHYELAQEARNYKRVERKIMSAAIASGKSLDLVDDKGRTALHRAAKFGYLKLFATLKYFNADTKVLDRRRNYPGTRLSQEESSKINRLQRLVSRYHHDMQLSAVDVFISRLTVEGGMLDQGATRVELTRLYQMPMLQPLFELAKLAMLGRHQLSKRKAVLSVDEPDYDSDQETSVNDEECLSVAIDPNKEDVEGMVHFGQHGLGGKNAYGVHVPVDGTYNAIFVAGQRKSRELVQATMIHELCHFLAEEVFGNDAKPYSADSRRYKDKFTVIAAALEKRKSELDPILQGAFDAFYKKQDQVHAELIVRVPQCIAAYPDGLDRLKQQAPQLLDYYQYIFLSAIVKHTEVLAEKAMGEGLSPALFRAPLDATQGSYRLSRRDEEMPLAEAGEVVHTDSMARGTDAYKVPRINHSPRLFQRSPVPMEEGPLKRSGEDLAAFQANTKKL